jgi:hypothetical protein
VEVRCVRGTGKLPCQRLIQLACEHYRRPHRAAFQRRSSGLGGFIELAESRGSERKYEQRAGIGRRLVSGRPRLRVVCRVNEAPGYLRRLGLLAGQQE